MRKLYTLLFLLTIILNLSAQPPGGGGGRSQGGPPPGGGRGGPPQSGMNFSSEEIVIIEFPSIENLELKQREKLSDVVVSERKELSKLMQERMALDMERKAKEKDKSFDDIKYQKKQQKIKEKENKVIAKADKKYRSILSETQYQEFLDKKKLIKFKGNRPKRGDGNPNRGSRGEGQQGMPLPEDMDMGFGGFN